MKLRKTIHELLKAYRSYLGVDKELIAYEALSGPLANEQTKKIYENETNITSGLDTNRPKQVYPSNEQKPIRRSSHKKRRNRKGLLEVQRTKNKTIKKSCKNKFSLDSKKQKKRQRQYNIRKKVHTGWIGNGRNTKK